MSITFTKSPFFLNYDHPVRSNYSNPLRPHISLIEKIRSIPILEYHEYFGMLTPLTHTIKDCGASIRLTDRMFRIDVDVQHFSKNDLTVRTGEYEIEIEGKHAEKEDEQGFISREFFRKFWLPRGVAPEKLRFRLCSDGVLKISAPRDLPACMPRCCENNEEDEEDSQATSDKEDIE